MNKIRFNKILLFYFISIIFFIAAFRPVGFDSDSPGYADWILSGVYFDRAEISFSLIVDFWRLLVPLDYVPRMVFVSYAIIHITILKLALDNYTQYKGEAFILYFLMLYSISTLTQIRVGVASAIFFWAIYDVLHRNTFTYFIKIALATSFHSMGVVFVLFYFINPKKINRTFYLMIFPIGVFFLQFMDVFKDLVKTYIVDMLPLFVGAKVNSYLSIDEQAISTFNIWFLFVVLIYYLVLLNLRKLDKDFILYVKVLGIGILLYCITNFISIMSIRVMNSVGLLLLFMIPALARVYKNTPLVWYSLFSIAFLIFINWHFRNELLHFDVLFK